MIFKFISRFNNKKDFPECWSEYLANFKEKPNIDVPISDKEFVVLDIESNGYDAKKDKILSIGAVKIKNNQINIEEAFEIFIEQSVHNPEAVPIHGIRKNGTVKKESEQEAMRKIVNYIRDNIIVGHSIVFDIDIVNETLKKYVGDKLRNKTIDTVNLYKRYKGADFRPGTSTSLDNLSDEFNIPKSDRHNAAGDALITAILFLKLTSRLRQRGIISLKDLLKTKKVLL